jgi:hypothetical protein
VSARRPRLSESREPQTDDARLGTRPPALARARFDGPVEVPLSRLGQDREAPVRLVEEDEMERRIAPLLTWAPSGWLDGAEMCGLDAEEDLERRCPSEPSWGRKQR